MSSKIIVDRDWVTFLKTNKAELKEYDEKLPASMRKKDIIKDAQKYQYGSDVAHIDLHAWNMAERLLHHHYRNIIGTAEVLPPSAALLDFRLTTSSTYQGKKVGPYKEDLLRELFSAKDTDSTVLAQLVEGINKLFELEVTPDNFYQHMLATASYDKVVGKDELRGSHKRQDDGSIATRSFIVPAIDVFILEKMLLSHQFDLMIDLSVAKTTGTWEPINVGIPVQHRGYDAIIRRTLTYASRVSFDTDKHDGRVRVEHFEMLARFHFALLRSKFRTQAVWNAILYVYWHAYAAVHILPDGNLAHRFSGQPSGRFGTLHDNSIITVFNHFYAFCKLYPGIDEVSSMYALITVLMYFNSVGDDMHVSHNLSPDQFELYKLAFDDLNFKLTTEPSTTFCSSDFSYDALHDCWYLQHAPDQSLSSMLFQRRNSVMSRYVLQYARVCGHLDLASASDIVGSLNGKPVTLFELLSSYLDWLEERTINGVPFIRTSSFKQYSLSTLRRTRFELDSLLFETSGSVILKSGLNNIQQANASH